MQYASYGRKRIRNGLLLSLGIEVKAPEKYALIGKDIHKLVYIKPGTEWNNYMWRIDSDTKNYYLVPVGNENKDGKYGESVIQEAETLRRKIVKIYWPNG